MLQQILYLVAYLAIFIERYAKLWRGLLFRAPYLTIYIIISYFQSRAVSFSKAEANLLFWNRLSMKIVIFTLREVWSNLH